MFYIVLCILYFTINIQSNKAKNKNLGEKKTKQEKTQVMRNRYTFNSIYAKNGISNSIHSISSVEEEGRDHQM